MYFESKGFFVSLVEDEDLEEVSRVYNSNKRFLRSHMDREMVTNEWLIQELDSMKALGFHPSKIVDRRSGQIVGIIDFKEGEETYLSLLMLHSDFKGKGFGKQVYQSFEAYVKSQKSKCIRIDVVTDYNNSVLDFWVDNGFEKFKDVELNWTGKTLPAVAMKKHL